MPCNKSFTSAKSNLTSGNGFMTLMVAVAQNRFVYRCHPHECQLVCLQHDPLRPQLLLHGLHLGLALLSASGHDASGSSAGLPP